MPPRLTQLVAGSLILVATLTACTTEQATEPAAAGSSERAELFGAQCKDTVIPDLPDLAPVPGEETGTRSVKSNYGTVQLPASPKAALGMYTTDVDMLIWLRFPLAKSQPIRGDSGYRTFPCFFPYDQLEGLKTFANFPDFDYEGVLAAKPDFILNGLGYDKKVVQRLPQIAPTYSVDAFDGVSWQTHFEQTAKALGREQYYQEWRALYDKRLAEVKSAIGDTAGLTVTPAGWYEGKVNAGCYAGVECQVFEDLGLTVAPVALANKRQGESLSGEQVGKLSDVDYVFTTKSLGAAGQKEFDTGLAEIGKNALWRELPFVKNKHIVTYEMEMTYGSPSGQLAFLDVVEKALGKN